MKRKLVKRILALSLSVVMCAQNIPVYAEEQNFVSDGFVSEILPENEMIGDETTETEEVDESGFGSEEQDETDFQSESLDGFESGETDSTEEDEIDAFVSESPIETGETDSLTEALAESEEMAEGDFSYVVVDDTYARITKYTGTGTEVEIPATLGDYPVTTIGTKVFANRSDLTQIRLPEGLTAIYAYAFENCSAITSMNLPDSITEIGYKAFNGCSSLGSINYPLNWTNCPDRNGAGVWQYGNVFTNCPNLTSMEIPEGVTKVAPYSFANCTSLTSVILPSTLTGIGESAFNGAKGLTEVTIPENVSILEGHAFANCSSLTSVYLPENLTSLYAYTFENCTAITSMELPDSITDIGYKAFDGCTSLDSINYPLNWTNCPDRNGAGVWQYGNVFTNCPNLTSMEIPEGITKVVPYSFANCTSLTSVTLPSTLTGIGESAFNGAKGLTEVTIPENVSILEGHAFANCSSLTNVHLPENLTSLYAYAFENCTSITSMHLPDSITEIGYKAFDGCSSLRSINYPLNWTNCPDRNGAGVWQYGNVFTNCPNLTSMEIPEGVTKIAPYSFANCTSFTNVTLSSTVTEIGNDAFNSCANLSKIYISDSVNKINENTFKDCAQMTIYCSYYSYGTIYAIENNLPFVSTGTYKDSDEFALERGNTSYYGNFESATANGYVAMTVRYSIKDTWKSSVDNMSVKLELPSNGNLDESTLKVDGELCTNYEYDNGRSLKIPVSNPSGIIRFSIKVQNQSDAQSYAILNLDKNGTASQEVIGIINEGVNLFTIDAPDIVSKATVSVSGMATPGETLTLLIDEKEQQTVSVSKAGFWSADLTIDNPSNYASYTIKALCKKSDGTEDARTAVVTYREGEPSIESFKVYYNEHNKIKSYDLTQTDGTAPIVYYLPGTKFDYELTFENADQIKELYVTSTRNNETKYLQATYDEEKKAFVTNGYFDESNHNYVPGVISYEYNRPVPSVTVGQDVDWASLQTGLLENVADGITVQSNTETDYQATIDMSKYYKDLTDVEMDVQITVFDETNGTNMGLWKDMIDEMDTTLSYVLPGYDDSKYIYNLDYSDKGTWYMLVKDVTGNKYIGFVLESATKNAGTLDEYWTLSQISSYLSTVNKGASMLYQNYQIEQDMDQLRKDVMSSGNYSSTEELNSKLKAVDNLESDQKMFMIMTAMIPLIVAGGAMGAAPAILLTGILGIITVESKVFWDLRKANIKGQKYKLRFIVDPSGYVYDLSSGERLEDVTVSAYWIPYDESDDFWKNTPADSEYGSLWNAGEYNQHNPLLTNGDGKYAWDVPEGWWRVKYEKEGYKTTWSDWMTVPPLRTEVNVGMESTTKPPVEHTWDNGTVIIAATCSSTGIISYECTDCHITRTEVLPINPKVHSWDNGVVTKAATCTEKGVKTYTCAGCNVTKTEEIAKTNHVWNSWKKVAEATVFTPQREKRTCSLCQTAEERNVGNALTSKMTLSATSLKMQIKQTTKAFRVSDMENGDSVESVVSGNNKLLKVASYTKDGAVTLKAQKKTGKTKLTIKLAGGAVKTVTVTIQKGKVKTTKISGLSKKITLSKGKKQTLKPVLAPITTQDKVTYTTSNKKICAVSKTGVVTAKKKGTAKITVRAGSKKAVVTVKVK